MSSRAELSIDIRHGARVSPSTVRTLRARVGRAMRAAGVAGRAMTLSLTDDRELRALNKKYANEDHATDVLSFEQAAPLLGDVIISVETAARQAKAAKHSLAFRGAAIRNRCAWRFPGCPRICRRPLMAPCR